MILYAVVVSVLSMQLKRQSRHNTAELNQVRIQEERLERSPLIKPTKVSLLTMIFYN